ncbi:lactate dehydrogenase-like 2-hydroxyacid dehydrogenase [Chitinophaga dinghuensis]|uniref:Lactate dehydrogenase-like 2-hydroxyacid dehydrogenase n=1 Tax=Chitinophaga dinghuensis TaxID=1539050 RepID=A0A327WJG5_9BACT|nr:D-glycerate dehydrogenase [Chitinophaga dinghuensis]RAJ87924.1 lactate dehydrogenase-like 2-hydroxyacid dehydrogenase [Chitinophaga dinghuensis]
MKVFATRVIPAEGRILMERAGINVTEWKERRNLSPDELADQLQDYDVLYYAGGKPMPRPFLEKVTHLKLIALMSAGYDNIDVAAARELGIPVTNVPGIPSKSTADIAFLLMQAVARKAFFMHQRILQHEWGFSDPTANLGIDLEGKTLGIWGLGQIGTVLAKRSRAFDMKLIYNNRRRNMAAEKEFGARYVSFEELLEQSDVLSVHTALTAATRGVFTKDIFRKMKPGAIFINTARGAIHDETALYEAIQEGLIWGAGLDVTNPEPMSPDSPLLRLPTVAILPHIGSATSGTRNAMASLAAENVIAAIQGTPLPNLIQE